MVPSESPNSAPSLVFMPLMIALCIIISVVLALLALQSIIIRVCMREQHEIQETRVSCMVGGVNKRALEAIPVYAYSTKNDEEHLECSVCLGELEEGESVRALPNCGHVFHCSCIDAWLVQHSTCPFCRSGVPIVEPLVVSVNQDGSINGDHDLAAGFSLAMVREKLRIKGALCLSCLTLFSFNDVVVENSEYSSSNV